MVIVGRTLTRAVRDCCIGRTNPASFRCGDVDQ